MVEKRLVLPETSKKKHSSENHMCLLPKIIKSKKKYRVREEKRWLLLTGWSFPFNITRQKLFRQPNRCHNNGFSWLSHFLLKPQFRSIIISSHVASSHFWDQVFLSLCFLIEVVAGVTNFIFCRQSADHFWWCISSQKKTGNFIFSGLLADRCNGD